MQLLECPFRERVVVHRADSEAVRAHNRGRFVLIVNEPMGERYKPAWRDFELCEAGRMLIVSAGISGEISRGICLRMSGMAEVLAAVC